MQKFLDTAQHHDLINGVEPCDLYSPHVPFWLKNNTAQSDEKSIMSTNRKL